mmetsp:Transcript_10942/g.33299  ORF Transcript_10942/g.33299 Transcript_10942/m.33299 type:complete len:513 (-) Transcript_10942:269-1807(-)
MADADTVSLTPHLSLELLSSSPQVDNADGTFDLEPYVMHTAFFADFGPVNIGRTVRCVRALEAMYTPIAKSAKDVVVKARYVGPTHMHSNAAFLAGAFCVLKLGMTPDEAFLPFLLRNPPLAPFRDASFGVSSWSLSVHDALKGLHRAYKSGHLNPGTFDADEYEYLGRIENGDVCAIIPGRFYAFSGPLPQTRQRPDGTRTLTAYDYVPLFKRLGINMVVRFNEKLYDRRIFLDNGIRHMDLQYEDGANPPDTVLKRFLKGCELHQGGIAVHCKAGLGRTGTNIAAYMIRNLGYSPVEAIAWCRIARPGMVVGPQQQYVVDLPRRMKQLHLDPRPRGKADGPTALVEESRGYGAATGAGHRYGQSIYSRLDTRSAARGTSGLSGTWPGRGHTAQAQRPSTSSARQQGRASAQRNQTALLPRTRPGQRPATSRTASRSTASRRGNLSNTWSARTGATGSSYGQRSGGARERSAERPWTSSSRQGGRNVTSARGKQGLMVRPGRGVKPLTPVH